MKEPDHNAKLFRQFAEAQGVTLGDEVEEGALCEYSAKSEMNRRYRAQARYRGEVLDDAVLTVCAGRLPKEMRGAAASFCVRTNDRMSDAHFGISDENDLYIRMSMPVGELLYGGQTLLTGILDEYHVPIRLLLTGQWGKSTVGEKDIRWTAEDLKSLTDKYAEQLSAQIVENTKEHEPTKLSDIDE